MDELPRILASNVNFRWLPGMACRDPQTGATWRLGLVLPNGSNLWFKVSSDDGYARAWMDGTLGGVAESECQRAMSAGALLDDWPTVGRLIEMLGVSLRSLDHRYPHGSWSCTLGDPFAGTVMMGPSPGFPVALALLKQWGVSVTFQVQGARP